jgi:hypothetical protein
LEKSQQKELRSFSVEVAEESCWDLSTRDEQIPTMKENAFNYLIIKTAYCSIRYLIYEQPVAINHP